MLQTAEGCSTGHWGHPSTPWAGSAWGAYRAWVVSLADGAWVDDGRTGWIATSEHGVRAGKGERGCSAHLQACGFHLNPAKAGLRCTLAVR
jgi:hypothetical protein